MDTLPGEARQLADMARSIQRVSAVLARISDKVLLENCGFGNSQFKLLWVLSNHPEGVPQKAIAAWLNQTEAGISRQIGILKERGLVDYVKTTDDKRTKVIILTPDGQDFTVSAIQTLVSEYAPDFSVLTDQEQKALITLLDKLFYRMCNKKPE